MEEDDEYIEGLIKEHEEEMEKYYELIAEEQFESIKEINDIYLNHQDKYRNETKEKTNDNFSYEIQYLKDRLLPSILHRVKYLLLDNNPFMNIANVSLYLHEILYSSLNSAVSGQYVSSITALRQFHELYFRAIFFDEYKKAGYSRKRSKKLEEWMTGEKVGHITGKKGLNHQIRDLISPENEGKLFKISHELDLTFYSEDPNIEKILDNIYQNLSTVLHTGIIADTDKEIEDKSLLPFDYNKNYFKFYYESLLKLYEISSLILIIRNKELLEKEDDKWNKMFTFDKEKIDSIINQ